ncbi:YcdB/YcdC domain-containing protein [Paenibacillus chitinolyticus]|uniref:YcdB/YcdC domain-containing protein n=1 Tax=Paenibacillus chitinolyticus TaxID=79263 RepID=UPI003670701D
MLIDELKQKAAVTGSVPAHFDLIIEDLQEQEDGETQALFVWQEPSGESGISVTLDAAGRLLSYSVDEELCNDAAPIGEEALRERARSFFLSQRPEDADRFVLTESRFEERSAFFEWAQTALDLPLPQTGAFIRLTLSGEVTSFTYKGSAAAPPLPVSLVQPERLRQQLAETVRMSLAVVKLIPALYAGGDDRLRLVYQPEPGYRRFDAVTGLAQGTDAEAEEEHEAYKAYELSPEETGDPLSSLEELIGISTYPLVKDRERDMDENLRGIVWHAADREENPADLSLDGYFRRRMEDTVKATAGKDTGRLRSFIWMVRRTGKLALSYEDCLERAEAFLRKAMHDWLQVPGLAFYFQEKSAEDAGSESEGQLRYFFTWQLRYEDVPLYLQFATLCVNASTGYVDRFSGPDWNPEEIRNLAPAAKLNADEAHRLYVEAVDFKLEWDRDYDAETPEGAYNLLYTPILKGSGRNRIAFIDAASGEFVTQA